jgi:hypothetical protein
VDRAALGQVFFEYKVSLVNYSTNFSIIIITRGWHNRSIGGSSAEWTQLDSTPPPTIPIKKIKIINMKSRIIKTKGFIIVDKMRV